MDPDMVIEMGRQALRVTSLISAPILLSALAVGLLVGMFQAATQINESTLSFIPKLIILVVSLFLAGPWMLELLLSYTRELFESIPMALR
ncbi:MAG: flagellar biosynthesis protein FliQ [Gammaproteobacteria bacterium]|nr:flagellar biosynthesis protein FliQ [Gammaproteobacteria bacterium]